MMTPEVAKAKMNALAEDAAARLGELGVSTSVEFDYMDRSLRTVDSEKKAKYMTVTVVITSDGIPEGEEYCLSLGAEIKHGAVDDEMLDRDSENFKSMISKTEGRLRNATDAADAIRDLTAEAEVECDRLLSEIEENAKKARRFSTISTFVILIIVIITYAVLMFRS